MRKVHARRYMIPAVVLAALGLVFWAGCSKNLMDADQDAPRDSEITNPVDGASLNSGTINVRGRAEVGATIDVFINDDDYEGAPAGTGISSPAVPNDGLGGRFTVEEVDLGLEGMKSIRARITDIYGNEAVREYTPAITIILDQTAPSIAFDDIDGAEWIDDMEFWESGLPEVLVYGSTDSSAAGARVRAGIHDYPAELDDPDPGTGIVNFTVTLPSPPLSGGHADTLIGYFLESFDTAGNVAHEPLDIHWEVEGREEELFHDDGVFNSQEHSVTGRPGQKIAVGFQAPTWANYVTKMIFYNANDQVNNPENPEAPSTYPFTAYVWRVTLPDSLPGNAGNDGYVPFPEYGVYPEDEWITVIFPTAVNIMDNSQYPDKKFYVGLEWEHRNSPYIWEDHSLPIAYKSFIWNWSAWELREEADTMIRAVVSDVPSLDGKGREFVLEPVRLRR